jgi:hypothetical protein
MSVIAAEVKQQLAEIVEWDKKLKIDRTPTKLGLGSSLLF